MVNSVGVSRSSAISATLSRRKDYEVIVLAVRYSCILTPQRVSWGRSDSLLPSKGKIPSRPVLS